MLDDFWNEVKGFLISPSETFKTTSVKSLSAAYQYFVALLVIFTILFGFVTVSIGYGMFTSMVESLSMIPIMGGVAAGAVANFSGFVIALGVFFVYLVFLICLLGIFVSGLFFHAFVLLLDGKKGFRETIKTTMYASTPFLLLGWIPFVSMIAYIWYLVLMVIGIKENHEMELGKAVLVVLIPIVLVIILMGLGSAVIIAFMSATASLIPKF